MPGSHTLVFETSTPTASLLLAGPDGVVAEREFCSDRSHNAVLFGPLGELMAGLVPSDIGLVLVGSGPGSYSGTRVGIAAAQGVALAAGCPVVAVPSILAAPGAANGMTCMVVGDARRGSFWISVMEHSKIVVEPTLIEGAEAFGHELDGILCAVTFETSVRDPFPSGLTIPRQIPTARLLWEAWQRSPESERARWAAESPQPLYLRPPHITESKRPWAGRL
ncbi:tRNA (adenosine(37)-N6)-threonylcarbamoyltransferase complex dimerization subunit type 1 TsaB [Luteolibacter ambystomatis]|uniref:tRNA (Adenosine(37)-N6)-threonylcarbamoyltransferase complex dimerization subunit type 1 TsaB n=1 Tax=Luteolibacter ambystomatis TaxID=2824561 RepID=A0A975G822_9BACT|nr:tRNA (adenosine(37)-N6)-threonylcarbamoyltransferase complex dimerization subunit type 1 TsaB [Luteolibacter ambystomatis]QUE50527.1 tRNA (adenosine(37)-N6)-threonylcarbamoyltransferase complex dimerization subunit type 1 TsaB [Luteolibacter ambystomatis]